MHILFAAFLSLFLLGCLGSEFGNITFGPIPDPYAGEKKAHADFLERAIVKEFAAEGLPIDCQQSICGEIPETSLELLKKFKVSLLAADYFFESITLVEEPAPSYYYPRKIAYLPAKLSEDSLNEFFAVLDSIHGFEKELGFRVYFPNHYYRHSSVSPLLQILKENQGALKSQAHRFTLLEVNSVYNRFDPRRKVVMLKTDDLKNSFSESWNFISLFFKAQDLFGNVSFDLETKNSAGIKSMETLLQDPKTFQPLLTKVQDRRISLFEMEFYGYMDAPGSLIDFGVSSSFDRDYLAAVFKDQARMQDLTAFLGVRVQQLDNYIELKGHPECLDMIESLKDKIKAKSSFLTSFVIASGGMASEEPSAFSENGHLFLNCTRPLEEMESVIEAIPSATML